MQKRNEWQDSSAAVNTANLTNGRLYHSYRQTIRMCCMGLLSILYFRMEVIYIYVYFMAKPPKKAILNIRGMVCLPMDT